MKKRVRVSKKVLQKQIETEIKKQIKARKILLESRLEGVENSINSLLTEVEEDSRNHILENQNNIFIPVLDESTGEKSYEPRNFDELLEECANDNSKTDGSNFDHIYEMLDESFDYEKQFYFEENLDTQGFYTQKQEKENMTLEEVKNIIREQEEEGEAEGGEEGGEEKKGFFQRAKEKVTGAAKGVVKTFKRSKLVFFLKIVQMGLKTALAATKGVFSLVMRIAVKMAKNFLTKLAAANMKVSAMWATVKEWGTSKLSALLEKILSPFLWIAKKITGSTAEAAEVAPLLFSITVMSLTLAWLYLSGGVAVFTTFTNSLSGGATAVLEAGGEELVGQVCMEAKTYNGQVLSGQLLVEQGCGIVDSQGDEISYDVAAQAMKNLGEKINAGLEEAKGVTLTSMTKLVGDEYTEASAADLGGLVDHQANALEEIRDHFNGVGLGQIRETGVLDMNDMTSGAKAALQSEIDAIQEMGTALPQVGEEGVNKLVDGMVMSHKVESVIQMATSASDTIAKELIQVYTNVKVVGVTGLDEEITLMESRLRRFQELAGVVKG